MSQSLVALFATLPSFAGHIPPDARHKMTTEEIFEPYLRPIFGSNSFPIAVHAPGMPQSEVAYLLGLICSVRTKLSRDDCLIWNAALETRGDVLLVPKNLEGSCVKALFPKGVCKASPDKWSCMGCGKSYVPDSYMAKSCKRHPDPLWLAPLSADVEALISEHGVSDKAPIVWINSEGHRLFVPKAERS